MIDDEPFSLEEYIYRRLIGVPERLPDVYTLAEFGGLKALYSGVSPDTWFIPLRTYEMLRFAHVFPQPTRKLRKVQLRRIAARKRAWRRHCARMRVNHATV